MRKLIPTEPLFSLKTRKLANKEIYDFLFSLKPGDKCIIEKSEWKGKLGFNHAVYNVKSLRRKFSLTSLKDKSGWVVERR